MDSVIFTYLVVFRSQAPSFEGPIMFNATNNGTMHLFDDEMYTTLDALEFLMHMPRSVFDIYDINEVLMYASHDHSHHIMIIPDKELAIINSIETTMIIVTDDCSHETKLLCEKLCPKIGTYYSKELNNSLLKTLWEKLQENYKSEEYSALSNIGTPIILQNEYLKALPTLFLSRQFQDVDSFLQKIYNSNDVEETIITSHWNYLSRLNTLFSLNKQGVTTPEEMNLLYEKQFKKEFDNLKVNVVITFPGIPKKQKVLGMNAEILSDTEKRIIRILGIHRAIARTGVFIELSCATELLFQKYDRLEENCKNGTNNKYVWRSLNDLGEEISSCFDKKQSWLLKRANDVTVFSDFPVGIAILPEDETPLQCYKSIFYQPLTPLTRRLQQEILKKQQYYLGESCKIAIAECIPDNVENSFIYKTGETLYSSLKEMQSYSKKLVIEKKQIDSISNMQKFINDNIDADILYISAHGNYHRQKNMAGIMIGNQFWMASENLQVPPIVILSACHTAPRGVGCITIADMFLRNGALTVLGTFIPVNAMDNLILMTRLFAYIAEAQKKNSQYKTLADAWRGIVASNAIHEILSASKRFSQWMHSTGKNGLIRIEDFQLNRCVGRLRPTHIYHDTITILKEMLEEEGMTGKFDNIVSQNDYFPESFFYQFLGNPENIFLYNEIFDDYLKRQK